MSNRLRELFNQNQTPVFGALSILTDPAVVEIIGLSGLEFVGFEMEHGSYGIEALQNCLRAAGAHGLGTLVKLPATDSHLLLRVLETGVDGVLLASSGDASTACRSAEACRYPPDGTRGGSTIVRGAGYGSQGMDEGLLAARGRDLVVGVLVENVAAVRDIDDVVASEAVDFISVGTHDLTVSMGATAGREGLAEAIDGVIAACKRAGKRFSLPVDQVSYQKTGPEIVAMGATIVFVTSDVNALRRGLTAAIARAKGS